jgi:hypothetical protein
MNALRLIAIIAALCAATLCSGCGGTDRRHSINSAATITAPYLELRTDTSAGTLHFPRGVYVLDSEDGRGYYYRAPRKVFQRSFSGGTPYQGGIFVSKRDPRNLRGYVIMPGGLTHVGNLSSANYQFRY